MCTRLTNNPPKPRGPVSEGAWGKRRLTRKDSQADTTVTAHMNRSSGQGGPPHATQGSTIAVAYAQSPADGTLPKYRDLSPEINPDGTRQDLWHDPSKVGGTSRESQMSVLVVNRERPRARRRPTFFENS